MKTIPPLFRDYPTRSHREKPLFTGTRRLGLSWHQVECTDESYYQRGICVAFVWRVAMTGKNSLSNEQLENQFDKLDIDVYDYVRDLPQKPGNYLIYALAGDVKSNVVEVEIEIEKGVKPRVSEVLCNNPPPDRQAPIPRCRSCLLCGNLSALFVGLQNFKNPP